MDIPRGLGCRGLMKRASQRPFDGNPYTRLAVPFQAIIQNMGRTCVRFKARPFKAICPSKTRRCESAATTHLQSRQTFFYRINTIGVVSSCVWNRAASIESGMAGAISIACVSNMMSIKNLTWQKIATAPAAINRLLTSSPGKTKATANDAARTGGNSNSRPGCNSRIAVQAWTTKE